MKWRLVCGLSVLGLSGVIANLGLFANATISPGPGPVSPYIQDITNHPGLPGGRRRTGGAAGSVDLAGWPRDRALPLGEVLSRPGGGAGRVLGQLLPVSGVVRARTNVPDAARSSGVPSPGGPRGEEAWPR